MTAPHRLRRRLGRLLFGLGLADVAAHEETLALKDWGRLAPREIRIQVPAQVRADTPLLLAFDGQMMREWRLAEALQAFAATHPDRAPLVVTIPASADRVEEYGLRGQLDYAGRGKLADEFQQFVLHHVIPTVQRRYGLDLAPARTGVFGASLGGLAAFDLAWHHPEVFGFVGVFSGSFWWRGDNATPAAQQASRLVHARVAATPTRPRLRLWFQAGTADETDDRDGNGVIDAIQDTTELIDVLAAQGFRRGKEITYREVPGGEHNERTWARELPGFLRWALAGN